MKYSMREALWRLSFKLPTRSLRCGVKGYVLHGWIGGVRGFMDQWKWGRRGMRAGG